MVVLSHELRSPVGVLQGYARLLGRTNQSTAPDPAILDGIQAGASRLASISHDAADLAQWLTADERSSTTTIATLVDAVRAQGLPEYTIAAPPAETGSLSLVTRDAAMLARALAVVARAAARHWDVPLVTVSVTQSSDAVATIAIAPPAPDATVPRKAFDFNQTGMGLSLLLASAVLDGHDATVSDGADGRVEVRLPVRQGRS